MIEINHISKRFGALDVLRDLSFTVDKGEVLAIVGPSGAGKTTLLQIMGSLASPSSGSVGYDGVSLNNLSNKELARFRNSNIGFVFQFHQLLPEFTVAENVAMPALIGGKSKKEAFARAGELIEYLGLSDRAAHKPTKLSGGECQRAAVARALVNSPMVVLADEPTGSLDSHNRNDLHRLFFDLRRDLGHTFVIVTHDEALARDCDRTVHLRDGSLSEITVNPTTIR